MADGKNNRNSKAWSASPDADYEVSYSAWKRGMHQAEELLRPRVAAHQA